MSDVAPSNGPISLTAPGVAPEEDEIELPAEGTPQSARSYPATPAYPPRERYIRLIRTLSRIRITPSAGGAVIAAARTRAGQSRRPRSGRSR